MIDEQLRSMTEQQIRARFRCAPAYYLQAKLEKKRALERLAKRHAPHAEPRRQVPRAEQPQSPAVHRGPEAAEVALGEPESLDIALPGFEILDAALAESDDAHTTPAQQVIAPGPGAARDAEHTQQAILETALADYSNWPLLPGGEPAAEPQPATEPEPAAALATESDLERKLELVLESEPDLRVVLESDPEIRLVLDPEPELWLVPERKPVTTLRPVPDNVTRADFGQRAPRTVRVVSVVMDRKRPNMVRVVGDTTRRAG